MKLVISALSLSSLVACTVQNDATMLGTPVAPMVSPVVVTTSAPAKSVVVAPSSRVTQPAATEDNYMTITEAPTYDAEGRNTESISVKLY